jgi:Family of unknown function (DUF6174)
MHSYRRWFRYDGRVYIRLSCNSRHRAFRLIYPLRRAPSFIIVALLAAAQEPSPEARLAAAEAKWAANKPTVYEFTFKQICFGPPVPPGKPGSEPIVFRVLNGVGYLQGAWADNAQARQGLEKFSTVEKQFAFIRAELAKHPYRTEIEYDPDLGYPHRVYIDPLANTSDEEYGFEVQGFRSLTR